MKRQVTRPAKQATRRSATKKPTTRKKHTSLDAVTACLDNRGFNYTVVNDWRVEYSVDEDHAVYRYYINVTDQPHEVHVFAHFDRTVPYDRMQAVAEAVTRVNSRLTLGNFDLDMGSGELWFRVAIGAGSSRVTAEMACTLLTATQSKCLEYGEAFLNVAFENADPAKATEDFIDED